MLRRYNITITVIIALLTAYCLHLSGAGRMLHGIRPDRNNVTVTEKPKVLNHDIEHVLLQSSFSTDVPGDAEYVLHYNTVDTVTLYLFLDSLTSYHTVRLRKSSSMRSCTATFSLIDFRVWPGPPPVQGRNTLPPLSTTQQPYVTISSASYDSPDSLHNRVLPFYVEDHGDSYTILPPTDSSSLVLDLYSDEYELSYQNLLTDTGICLLPTQLTITIETGPPPPVRDPGVLSFTGENRITEYTYWNAEGTEGQTKTVIYDGFGREERTVLENHTPQHNDLVSLTEYDGFGRRTHTWLPTPVANSGTVNGRTVPIPEIKAAAAGLHQGDMMPFELTQYEANPLVRVAKVTGAGEQWHSNDRSVRTDRMTNRTSVDSLRCRLLTAEDGGDTVMNVRCTGDYADGTLYVERTADEDGRTLLTFTDRQGRKVLERRICANESTTNSPSSNLDTYYVYDGLGQLRAVLPPVLAHELLTGSTLSTEGRDIFAYLYQYDNRGNCIAKKLPGCAWTRYAYDAGNRPVLSQDGRQRAQGRMTYILYDPAGREAVRGSCQGSPAEYRNTLYGIHALAAFTGDIHGPQLGYTPPAGWTQMDDAIAVSANYYDSYAFNDSLGWQMPDNSLYEGDIVGEKRPMTNGLLTGTAVRSGEKAADAVLYSMTIYGYLTAMPVYTIAQNALGGTDITQTTYDYAGRPSQVLMSHMADTQMSTVEAQISVNYSYDNGGRVSTITQTLNGGTPVVIAQNEYDELGMLTKRQRGGNGRLSTDYTYNIRGWTTAITAQPFSEYLYYHTVYNGSTPQWAGNISAMDWKSGYGNDNGNVLPLEGYTFAYDGMSRLTQADYHTDGNRSTHYDTRYTYDSMGNILTLKRRGMMEKPDTAAHTPATYADIDDLTFDYDGNQIIKVTDAVDDGPYYQGAWHYRDNADKQQERFYDGNGNLTKDLDAKISDIQYNSLNLPIMITFTDGSTTRYTYDAAGRKLRVEHKVMTGGVFNPGQELLDDAGVLDEPGVEMPAPDFPGLNGPAAVMMPQEMEQAAAPAISDAEEASGSQKRPRSTDDAPAEYLPYELTVTDYCGNFIYENGKLSRILFDGGFITFPDTMVNEVTIANIHKPQYHFYFTDHLGNIRVVTDAQGNVEQVNNYYPYGGLMASSSTIANPVSQANVAANQPNRYNGKELDRKNGLDWLDYGARHFAGHGQWTSLDPLAEKYYEWSPYVYCVGNPMRYIDPNGMDWYETSSKNIMWKESVKSQSDLSDDEKYIGESYHGLKIINYSENNKRKDKGLDIFVEYTPDKGDDGNYNWFQTIFTDKPSKGNKSHYIDSTEGSKLYLTDDEKGLLRIYANKSSSSSEVYFMDGPGRQDDNVSWSAELSLVRQNNEGYSIMETISYGFKIKTGVVSLQPLSIIKPSQNHENLLKE